MYGVVNQAAEDWLWNSSLRGVEAEMAASA
jgi:hypothetical protein